MSFPFLTLPQVIQREVLSKLDILDAFTFSLLSKETFSISKSIHKLTYMEWTFEEDTVKLRLSETKNKYDRVVTIVVRTRREGEAIQTDHGRVFIGTHEVVLKTERNGSKQLIVEYGYEAGTDLYELMAPIWNHILSMIRRRDDVKHEVSLTDMSPRPAFKALELSKHFNYVDIIDDGNEVTADQIRFLFEEISCRNMGLRMNLPRDNAYLQPIEHSHLVLEHVEWISFEALLKSQFIELTCLNDSLSDAQLNAILKTWLQGGLPNLQQLEMNILLDTGHSKEAILEGIPWVPFTERGKPNYAEQDCYINIEKYHSGFDVPRADGMCATLVIDEETRWMNRGGTFQWMGSIELFVWKKEYLLLTDED